MTLRSEIEALLVEFEHFAYEGAPLDVAVEKLQEILAKTKPRVLTSAEELDSLESPKGVCLVPNDGSGPIGFYDRTLDGQNEWAGFGSDHFQTSAEVFADFEPGHIPSFTLIRDLGAEAAAAPKVLTTEDELNSEEAFSALCIMPYGGPLRTASSRSDGVNFWQEPGYDGEYSSAELLTHFASIGAEPAFTLIEH